MARAILARELGPSRAGCVDFALASSADDEDISRLLRENPIPGDVSVSFEREPDYFADTALPGELKQTIIARDSAGLVGAGSCVVRNRFVNGVPRQVGYLAGLRLDARNAGRFDLLRRGYHFFHQLQIQSPADYYFTSIAADNERARRFLERRLPGMPHYAFVGDFVTLLLPAARGTLSRAKPNRNELQAWAPCIEEVVPRLNACNREHQFAPCWAAPELFSLRQLGLQLDDFRFVCQSGRAVASAALWDQRAFRQTVIRGYAPHLAASRPLLNALGRLLVWPRLPAVGEPLANALVSHLAVGPDDADSLIALVAELRRTAARRQLELLTFGFAANDPRLGTVRRNFRCREYHSRFYCVSWPNVGGAAHELDGRLLAPEVALL